MYIPNNIKRIIGKRNFSIDRIGMSEASVICCEDMVLKVEKSCVESDNENKMMEWLWDKIPVPKIIYLEKVENKNYLLMSKINGRMSCEPEFLENPEVLVDILVQGLRMLWSIDISNCPCNNSIENKLKLAEERIKNKLCFMENVDKDTYCENGFNSPNQLLEWLRNNRPTESYVLSHGDYGLPNIFIDNNKISGFIDLGRAGIADKYQDIAICYRSLVNNFSGKYGGKVYENFNVNILFEKLGINPDWNKIKYYMLLDELF